MPSLGGSFRGEVQLGTSGRRRLERTLSEGAGLGQGAIRWRPHAHGEVVRPTIVFATAN